MDARPLRLIRNFGRMGHIASVLLNHGFDDLVERLQLGHYLRWGQRVILRRRNVASPLSRAQHIRRAFEELGPTFIKFGQVLSTRPDIIPPDVIAELKHLRENVPPFDSRQALDIIAAELEKPAEHAFRRFDIIPTAGGSLAQVHRAQSHDGRELAVKIMRPGAADNVERDLELMVEFATLLLRYVPEAEAFDPIGLVNHFARTIRREMDLTREARTLIQFHRLFRNDATLYVPQVLSELSTRNVLTMEFVAGLRVDDADALRKAGLDPDAIAANGARIFMKQAFQLGVFHSDPHPGNIRVMSDGSLCLLDYGMIGILDEELRNLLVDLLQAVITRDLATAVRLIKSLNPARHDIDVPLLKADLRDFIDTYYGLTLNEIDVGNLLSDFVRIITSHGIRCPGDLLLLTRAFVTLEGVGKTLSPTFNVAEVLQPFLEDLIRQKYSPRRIAGQVIQEATDLFNLCRGLPGTVAEVLDKMKADQLKFEVEHKRLDRLITELDRSSNRIVISLILSALIVASSLVLKAEVDSYWISIPIYAVSSFLGIWLIYGVFRSGRL